MPLLAFGLLPAWVIRVRSRRFMGRSNVQLLRPLGFSTPKARFLACLPATLLRRMACLAVLSAGLSLWSGSL